MRYAFWILIGFVFYSFVGFSQLVNSQNPIAALDFDDDGLVDVEYGFFQEKRREMPETWLVAYSIEPWRSNRFLRASKQRLGFLAGETISQERLAVTNFVPNDPRPPSQSYEISLLFYRAVRMGDWVYSVAAPAHELDSDLLLGLRLSFATGTHYGWLRLGRPVADEHTEFEIKEYRYHPVPGAPIGAGEPPGLPPLQAQLESAGLSFTWDSRWGGLVLESATNLVPPISWETVAEGNGGPVDLPVSEEQRFYRLREP